MDMQVWTASLAEPLRDRPVIVGFDPLAGMTRTVANLREWGARRPLLIARGLGTGPLPSAEDAEVLVLDAGTTTMMSEDVRAMTALAEDLPAEVVERVGSYDPAGEAVWWVGPFVRSGELLGRPVLGGRPAAWAAIEDKTTVDELWVAAGIEAAPARVVPAELADLAAAAAEVGDGRATVWSGDTRDGINGGADYVRWVQTSEQAREAARFFAARCSRVRVMPFLEGVPCSIHGLVLPDGVAVLRPVEMVVLRDRARGRFSYAGISTWWDPPAADRVSMRAAARRAGALLGSEFGFRGGFSLDGVLTEDGFLPTELNSRFSGGLARISRAVPELPMVLLQANLVSGRDARVSAATLEELLVPAADANRSGDAIGVSGAVRMTETHTVDVVVRGDAFAVSTSDGARTGTILAGPNAAGAFIRFEPAAGALAVGERMAPYATAMLAFADATWGTDFGALEAAPDVRTDLPAS
jgi:hypothetical protein